VQAADQPDHDGNDQYQAKNAAKAAPAIPAVTIVAAASEQQNQQDDNQNCTHVTPSLKFQFILEVSVYGFRPPTSKIPPHLEAQEAADDPPSITLLGRLLTVAGTYRQEGEASGSGDENPAFAVISP
jgi:hypothetical protein